MIEGKFTSLFLSHRNKSPLKNVSSFSGLQYWSAFLADFCGVEGVLIVSATFCSFLIYFDGASKFWHTFFLWLLLRFGGARNFCNNLFQNFTLLYCYYLLAQRYRDSIICLLFERFFALPHPAEITLTTESRWDYRWLLLLLWVCKFFQIQK